jgi:hypothetical protein
MRLIGKCIYVNKTKQKQRHHAVQINTAEENETRSTEWRRRVYTLGATIKLPLRRQRLMSRLLRTQ